MIKKDGCSHPSFYFLRIERKFVEKFVKFSEKVVDK